MRPSFPIRVHHVNPTLGFVAGFEDRDILLETRAACERYSSPLTQYVNGENRQTLGTAVLVPEVDVCFVRDGVACQVMHTNPACLTCSLTP